MLKTKIETEKKTRDKVEKTFNTKRLRRSKEGRRRRMLKNRLDLQGVPMNSPCIDIFQIFNYFLLILFMNYHSLGFGITKRQKLKTEDKMRYRSNQRTSVLIISTLG